MAKISIPVNNVREGENSLLLWCPDNDMGSVLSIKITSSEEAGLLRDSFKPEGGLSGTALTDGQVTANQSAATMVSYVIADMESDGRLSPAEKATWRQSWNDIAVNFIKAKSFAESAEVDTSTVQTAYSELFAVLSSAGVWGSPESTYILSGSEITDAAQIYTTSYKELSIATTNKIAQDTEEAAAVDATTKADAAKDYAAEEAAAKATLAEETAKVYADGIVTTSEALTLAAAQTKADLAEVTAKAYADGIVTDEEARAIADATTKANAAQTAANNYTQSWSDFGADVTGDNVAASVYNQGALALMNSVSDANIVSIDGGKITAYSVAAYQIASNAIFARHLTAKTVTADKMAASSITADNAALGDACVDTLTIAGNAVTIPVFAYGYTTYVTAAIVIDRATVTSPCWIYVMASLVQSEFSEITLKYNKGGGSNALIWSESPAIATLASKGWAIKITVPATYNFILESTNSENTNGASIYLLATKR